MSSLPRTCSWTAPEMQTPPGSASASNLAAVHAIPVDAVTLCRDVPQIHPDPEEHPSVLGEALVSDPQHALDFHCALRCVEGTRKLGQEVVAGGVDHAAVVVTHQVADEAAVGSECLDGALLVLRHEAGVAGHVGGEDGGETALGAFGAH